MRLCKCCACGGPLLWRHCPNRRRWPSAAIHRGNRGTAYYVRFRTSFFLVGGKGKWCRRDSHGRSHASSVETKVGRGRHTDSPRTSARRANSNEASRKKTCATHCCL